VQVALDILLVRHHLHVVIDLVDGGADDALALDVVLRTARPTEDLLHVEYPDVPELADVAVVDLRALDDRAVSGQVDAPRQRRRRAEHLDVAALEELL